MKRPNPSVSRNGHFLTQKKIRSYLESKEEEKPLLTAALRYAMSSAVRYQLDLFKESAQRPLVCALNPAHIELEENGYIVAYQGRYFDTLANAFLKMFSSFKRPTEFDKETGNFLSMDDHFHRAWVDFHQKRANLRILCHSCCMSELAARPPPLKSEKRTLSINDVLRPYKGEKEYEHQWLNIASWGERTNKGSYRRELLDKPFTLYQKDGQWRYVYNNQFSKESFDSLKDVLRETYRVYGEVIRRFV